MELEEMGLTTLEPVAKGKDAVKIAFLEHPSIIQMDIRLAESMDGIVSVEQILFLL